MSTHNETSLVLRVCAPDMTSRGGFKWPGVGETVSAPDWEANSECGAGLHGWLYGQGDHSCVSYWQQAEAKWLVLEVRSADIIMLGGKCKFPRAVVRFVGTKSEAADYIVANEPRAASVDVIGLVRLVGDKQSTLVGALGTATAGNYGTATAGEGGTATAGEGGELRIQQWDTKADRYRTRVGYVGEDGIKAETKYQLDDAGKFVEVQP